MQTARNLLALVGCLALIQAALRGRSSSGSTARVAAADTNGLRRVESQDRKSIPIEATIKCNNPHGNPCGPDTICVDNDHGFQCKGMSQRGIQGCPFGCGPHETCTQTTDTTVWACVCNSGFQRPTPYLGCTLVNGKEKGKTTIRDLEPQGDVP